jgi:hypothetical protein
MASLRFISLFIKNSFPCKKPRESEKLICINLTAGKYTAEPFCKQWTFVRVLCHSFPVPSHLPAFIFRSGEKAAFSGKNAAFSQKDIAMILKLFHHSSSKPMIQVMINPRTVAIMAAATAR